MSDALYERYKEALRRGHVASQRGRLDEALDAYGEAARVAPDRALPLVGIGQVLTRLGKSTEALSAFDLALDRSPSDEAALRGRADALLALGDRVRAAETLDRLGGGRWRRPVDRGDALDARGSGARPRRVAQPPRDAARDGRVDRGRPGDVAAVAADALDRAPTPGSPGRSDPRPRRRHRRSTRPRRWPRSRTPSRRGDPEATRDAALAAARGHRAARPGPRRDRRLLPGARRPTRPTRRCT